MVVDLEKHPLDMATQSPENLFEEEDYKLFKEANRKALMTNQESFSFKGNFYMTKFAKELLIHNNLKNGKNEKSNDGNPR